MKQVAQTIVVPIESSEPGSLRTLSASIEDSIRERRPGASTGTPYPFADVVTFQFAHGEGGVAESTASPASVWSDFPKLALGWESRT
jgi:hypothetical protein